jgi:hypothetical protein
MPRGWPAATIIAGLVLLGFAVAHSIEDFVYGVPHERFGIDTSPAIVLLAVALVVQVVLLLWVSRGALLAYVPNAVMGGVWTAAAALDHLGEVVSADLYRAGAFSKILEVGLMLSGLALALVALTALTERPYHHEK